MSLVSSVAWARLAQIKSIRISASVVEPRIVLDLSRSTYYRIFHLRHPERVVVDVRQAHLAASLDRVKKPAVITSLRSGRREKRSVRLVFGVGKKIKRIDDNFLKATRSHPARIVIDLTLGHALKKQSSTSKQASEKEPENLKPYYRKVVVVIDPGHGGRDPGAMGTRGIREKEVVLNIAKALQRFINREPGMQAVLTRRGDYYVGLRQRLRIARREKGDLFVSVHADSFKNKRARGASIYMLSRRGSSSEAARWLAEKENRSELLGGIDFSDRSSMLRSVLLDLSQTATKQASQQVGDMVLQSLSRIVPLHYRRVERAGFVVLKSPDIPSILVETGFISNPHEARRLNRSSYQRSLAKAILTGVRQYFVLRPPGGTWFAWRRQSAQYRVARGDSLSTIANRFEVGIAEIKAINKLTSSTIRVGQSLRIPPAD